MSLKNKTIVRINGIEYNIVSQHPEEYVQKIASYINRIDNDTVSNNPKLSNNMMSVLVKMNIADNYFKAVKDSDNLRLELKEYLDEVKRSKIEKETLNRKIAKMEQKNQDLIQQIHNLQIELAKKETELKEFIKNFDNPKKY